MYDCIDRPLAMMQLCTVTSELSPDFDILFVPGEDRVRFLAETRGQLTYGLANLLLSLEAR